MNTPLSFCPAWILLLLLIIALPSYSQTMPYQDNLNYAQKLAEHGYFDMADEICGDLLKTSSLSPETSAQIKITLVRTKRLQSHLITKLKDSELRRQITDKIALILDDIIANYPTSPVLSEAQRAKSEILIEYAMWLTQITKMEIPAQEKQKLIQEVEQIYSQNIPYLAKLLSDYRAQSNIPDGLSDIAYLHAISYYHYAQVYNSSKEKYQALLREAINHLTIFISEWGELRSAYEADDYCGLCHYETENYSQAKNFFYTASYVSLGIIDTIQDETERALELEAMKQVIQRARAHYAMAANACNEYQLAIQSVDELFAIFPQETQCYEMQLALIEKGYACYKLNYLSGVDIIKKIAEEGNPAAREARELISRIIDQGGKNIPPEFIMTGIRTQFGRNNYTSAIRQAQLLLSKLFNAPDEEKTHYLPEALCIMGEALLLLDPARYYESIIAYESVFTNPLFKAVRTNNKWWGPLALKVAAEIYDRMGEAGNDEADRKKGDELIARLMKDFPDSPEALNNQYIYASRKEKSDDYLKAAESFLLVPASSPRYFDAQLRAGYMYYLQITRKIYPNYLKEPDRTAKEILKLEIAKYTVLAEQQLNELIRLAQDNLDRPTVSGDEKKKISRNRLISYVYLGRLYIHESNRKYDKALALMEESEKLCTQLDDKANILGVKIEALIELCRMDEAETLLSDFQKATRYKPMLASPLLQSLAIGYEKISDKIVPPTTGDKREERLKAIELLRTQDKERYTQYTQALAKSYNFYAQWTEPGGKITANIALIVADKIYQGAEEIDQPELYTHSARIYENILNQKFEGSHSQPTENIRFKQTHCYTRTNQWTKALPILESLHQRYPGKSNIIHELARTYTELYLTCKDNSIQAEAYLLKARELWKWLAQNLTKYSMDWWNARYHIALVESYLGRYREAYTEITKLEQTVNKDFDDGKWGFKDKFLELKKELEKKLPGK